MDNQGQENKNAETESGDPGRTPGAAEGDRDTVEADLEEKQLDDDSKNNEQNRDTQTAESASGNNQ
jgi:hypothetical protein